MAQASRANQIAAQSYNQQNHMRGNHVAQYASEPMAVPELSMAQDEQRLSAMLRGQIVTAAAVSIPQVIASVPLAPPLANAFSLLENANSSTAFNEAINRIATAIADSASKHGTKVFAFASVGGTFDAALTTVIVARALAAAKCKTMVLDLSGTRPSTHDLMTLGDGAGLTDIVLGAVDVARVVQRDPKSNVQLIRYGSHQDVATRDMLAVKIPSILAAMTQVYDVVLINVGEAAAHTPNLLQGSGAVFFLAPTSRQKDAVAASRSLAAKNIRQTFFVKLDDGFSAAQMTG